MTAPLYHPCPFCLAPKGAEEKQACNRCWAMLSHAAKVQWYRKRAWQTRGDADEARRWFQRVTGVAA